MNSSAPFKKHLFSGLRTQLILGIAFIIVVSISLFVMDQVNRQKVFFLKLNHDRGTSLSENLANIATSHVAAYEIDGLQNLLKTYKKMPGLEYALVTSPDGIVLAHTDQKYLGLKSTDSISTKLKPVNATQILLENNAIFDVASPVVHNDEIIGWARIGLSQTYLTANLADIKKRGILYILISILAGSLLAIVVAGRLSKGLQKLVAVAQKIKDGNRELRADPSKSIEVTELGVAINQMLDDISTNEKLLRNVLENLPVGVFILDAKGKVLSLNPAAQQIWEGAKYVDQGEYNVYKGWFPNGKEIESHEWGAAVALNENRAVLNQEAEIEGFDGNRKTILNSCIPLHDDNENIISVISINVDITERKKAEEKLRESAERYRSIITVSNTGAWEYNSDSGYLWCSQEYFSMLGRNVNDYDVSGNKNLQETWIDLLHPLDVERASNHFAEYLKNGSVGMYESYFRMKNLNGDWIWIWSRGQTLRDANGKPTTVTIGTHIDITEQRKTSEMFRYQFENSPDIILIVNRNLKIESINRSRPDGPTPQQLIGMDCIEVLPEESREISRNAINECFENGKNNEIENTLHSNRWVRSRFVPIKIDDVISQVMIIGTDITNQKRAQQQVELEKLLSDSIINSMPGIFYMRDKSGTLLRWNKNAELFFGSNKKEAEMLNTLDFVDDSQKEIVKESHKEAQQKGISETIVYLKNSEGKNIPYFFTGRKLNFDSDEFVIAIGIDISERVEAENKLTERAAEIQKLSAHLENAQEEERTRIAREIHDELGQQLTGLKMDAFVVSKNIEEDKKKAADKVNEMVKLIDFAIKTVRRISSDLRPGVLDDLGLMAAIEWQGQEFEKRTGIKLVFKSDLPDLNPERNLSTNVFRVYQEILTNVMRHAKASLVETKLAVKENNIILEVKDNGQGFIFEEVKNKGSLGLVGMKERVLLFNGNLDINSKVNEGTLITLKVPIINNKN